MSVAREAAADRLVTDVPTPAATLATARALPSPRARAGLDALPAERQATTAHAVATGEHTAAWDLRLSEGQPWPDVIEYRT